MGELHYVSYTAIKLLFKKLNSSTCSNMESTPAEIALWGKQGTEHSYTYVLWMTRAAATWASKGCCNRHPHRWALRASGQTRTGCCPLQAVPSGTPPQHCACRGLRMGAQDAGPDVSRAHVRGVTSGCPDTCIFIHREALNSLIWEVWFSLVNSNLVMFWWPGFHHKNSHVSWLFAPVPHSYRRGCLMDRTHTHVNGLYMKYRENYTHTHFTGLHMKYRENYTCHTHTLLDNTWNTEKIIHTTHTPNWLIYEIQRKQYTSHTHLTGL